MFAEIDEINKKVYEKSGEKINELYDWGRKVTLLAFEDVYKILGTKFNHYFFESEVKLEGFLNNVASNLKKNGIFICTFMDGDSVESALKNDGIIEGRKNLDNTSVLIWAIIKRFINNLL